MYCVKYKIPFKVVHDRRTRQCQTKVFTLKLLRFLLYFTKPPKHPNGFFRLRCHKRFWCFNQSSYPIDIERSVAGASINLWLSIRRCFCDFLCFACLSVVFKIHLRSNDCAYKIVIMMCCRSWFLDDCLSRNARNILVNF